MGIEYGEVVGERIPIAPRYVEDKLVQAMKNYARELDWGPEVEDQTKNEGFQTWIIGNHETGDQIVAQVRPEVDFEKLESSEELEANLEITGLTEHHPARMHGGVPGWDYEKSKKFKIEELEAKESDELLKELYQSLKDIWKGVLLKSTEKPH